MLTTRSWIPLLLVAGFALSRPLSAHSNADEKTAAGKRCEDSISDYAGGRGAARFLRLTPKGGVPFSRPIAFPREESGHAYEDRGVAFRVRVRDPEEAFVLFSTLVSHSPPLAAGKIERFDDRFEIPFVLGGVVKTVPIPSGEGRAWGYELEVYLPRGSDKEAGRSALGQALSGRCGPDQPATSTEPTLPPSAESPLEWAHDRFTAFSKKLPFDQRWALKVIGGSRYEEIQSDLRRRLKPDPSEPRSRSRMEASKETVRHIDKALKQGKLDRDITLFRADSRPELLALAQRVASGEVPAEATIREPAYTFGFLHWDEAAWWNRTKLLEGGVVIQLKVPKGTPAAFLDAVRDRPELDVGARYRPSREFGEILLSRNSKWRLLPQIERGPQGQPMLTFEFVP